MKDKLLLVLLIVGLLVPFAQAQDEPVTITAWGHNYLPRVALDQEMIAAFMEDNPHITVEYNPVPSDFYATLNTAMASGAGPDMFNQPRLTTSSTTSRACLLRWTRPPGALRPLMK